MKLQISALTEILTPKNIRINLADVGEKNNFWKPTSEDAHAGIALYLQVYF